MEQEALEALKNKLLLKYHKYIILFTSRHSEQLPPHHTFDYTMDLLSENERLCELMYSLLAIELEELKIYLDKMIQEGKIGPSYSTAGAPIRFVSTANRMSY